MVKEFFADPGLQRLNARLVSAKDRTNPHCGLVHLSADFDVCHPKDWYHEVPRSLAQAVLACARPIAYGALKRLVNGLPSFDRCADQFIPLPRH